MEKGEGYPLVFLHGFGLNKESFYHQTEYFAKHFRVIGIDFLGAGKSSPLKQAFGVQEYAEGIQRVLKQMGIEKAILLGHSFGGRIAIYLAAHTDIASALILANSAGVKPRFSLRKLIRKHRFVRRKNKMGETERMHSGSPDYQSLSPIAKRSFSKVIGQDLTPLLRKISCPTLVISGKKDRETPPYTAKKLKKHLPNAKLIILPKADHFAFMRCSEQFNVAVHAFLRKCGGWNV